VILEYHEPRSVSVSETGLPGSREAIAAQIADEERVALASCAALVTVSRHWADEARAVYSFQGPVWTIPNAADAATFGIRPEERRPVPGRVLYVGSISVWKGLDLALEALARAQGVELHICGGARGSGPWRQLEGRAGALGVAGRVRMHGTVTQPELRPLLATAAAGLLPLDGRYSIAARHTSPLKLFEYLCAGLPVVATDLPSVREILGDGAGGLLFAPGDVEGLATCMQSIVTDQALMWRLGDEARTLGARHTWRQRGERVMEVCREVQAARQRPLMLAS
jgi:glycosyltransferase involved in cell wall biosynthesis